MVNVSKGLRAEIVRWGQKVFDRHLVSGWGGNISCRYGKSRYLITCQRAALGLMTPKDVVEIDARGRPVNPGEHPSSETSLHLAVYAATDARAIIHAHPPAVIAYSLGRRSFVPLSFEEKYMLGEVPILSQDTPTVTEPARVVEELRLRPVVILQGHGTVACGEDLRETFLATDLLEEAVRCQFWSQGQTPADQKPLSKGSVRKEREQYLLFSDNHIAAMVDRVNADQIFQKLGQEKGLTTSLTMAVEDDGLQWTFYFQRGKITKRDTDRPGAFVISGKKEWWQAVFQRGFDPFLATQQGKLKLVRGEFWQLSQWFKPFQRGFELWQAIPTR